MEHDNVPEGGVTLAFEYLLISAGLLLLIISLALVGGIIGSQGYSITSLTVGMVGILLMSAGGYNLTKKSRPFILLSLSSLVILYLLAFSNNQITLGQIKINLYSARGTVALLIAIFIITFIILKLRANLNTKRRIYQSLSLILFNLAALGIVAKHVLAPGLHCYACPWATAGCPIGLLQNWIIMGEIPYYLFGSMITFFALVGRAFCGWACPFGYLHDIIDKVTNVKYTRSHLTSTICSIKHLVLRRGQAISASECDPKNDNIGILTYTTRTIIFIATIITSWKLIDTWFCKLCPAGLIEAALPYRLANNVVADPLFILRVVIFASLIILAIVISRFWCRYFCPVGHLAGHFNRVSLVRLKLDEEKCNDCGLCQRACPMELYPVNFLKKGSCSSCSFGKNVCEKIKQEQSNCILCGDCVDACRKGALTITALPSLEKKPKKKKTIIPKEHNQPSKGKRISAEPAVMAPVRKEVPKSEYKQSFTQPSNDIRDMNMFNSMAHPVHIHVFYSSMSQLPSGVFRLKEMDNYIVHTFDINEEWGNNYYTTYYSEIIDPPVVLVSGQLYTGDIDNLQELLSFVNKVERPVKDIYITCTGQKCSPECRANNCSKALGNIAIEPGKEYPLTSLGVTSLGVLLTSCPHESIWAIYGSSKRGKRSVLKHKVGTNYKRSIEKQMISENISQQRFVSLPIVSLDIQLKKGSHTSNEVLNTVARGSFYSGGKLRYNISEYDEELPTVYVNRQKVMRFSTLSSLSSLHNTIVFAIKEKSYRL